MPQHKRYPPRRGQYQQRRHAPSRQRGRVDYIDPARFINKAQPAADAVAYVPTHTFNDFAVDERLKARISARGFTTPTPIQDRTIPEAVIGRDVVGIADTGTGKTAAFLIPLLDKVIKDSNQGVLIMVPTRELALQIEKEFKAFAAGLPIMAVSCVGGAPIMKQISALKRYPHFVIGTPGRLKDLLERQVLVLKHYQTVVLDEADRMLDMGFLPDMRLILSQMPVPRHTLFFSATMSREVEKLIGEFLKNPAMISVKTGDTSQNVEQDVVRLKGAQKIEVLHDLLTRPEFEKVIIFGRTKHEVERLANALVDRGFKAESLHGDKTHNKRQRALGAFKEGQSTILVATDVAARGLDIPNVSHVINFDIPATYDDYVHRIGRTGRGEKRGVALTFVP